MRAQRSLQRLKLLLHIQRAGNDDAQAQTASNCRNAAQEIQTLFAVVENVIENDDVRRIVSKLLQSPPCR